MGAIHAATAEGSRRLRKVLGALRRAGKRGLSTAEIMRRTGGVAIHTDVAELRARGYRIDCKFAGAHPVTRRRRYVYRLVVAAALVLAFGPGCGGAAPASASAAIVEGAPAPAPDPGAACPGSAPPLRAMVAGDSVACGTNGTGGFRGVLGDLMGPRFEWVGPRDSAMVCGGPGRHAAYPGSHTTGYSSYLPGYLEAYRPDVLVMMLGTNGDGDGADYVRILARPALDSDPELRLFVLAIPDAPVQGDYPASYDASLAEAIAALPEYGTRAWYVPETEIAGDQGLFDADGLHPNTAGDELIGQAIAAAFEQAGLVSL